MKIFTIKSPHGIAIGRDITYELTLEGEDVEISDGFHTMNELYDHRRALTAALFNQLNVIYKLYNNVRVFKARKHFDGTMFDGYFIVVACFDNGKNQISYHYDLKYWDDFKIEALDSSPFEYDGHTSKDVIERLLKL